MNVNNNSCTIFLWALSISVVLAFTRAGADPANDGYYLGDGSQDIEEPTYEAPDGELDIIPGGYSGFSSEDDGPIYSDPAD